MALTSLLPALLADPAARHWREAASDRSTVGRILVAPGGAVAAATALAAHPEYGGRPLLVVTATVRQAEDLTEELGGYLPPDSVALFPAWETLPHERLSPGADLVGERLAVLRRLAKPERRGGPHGRVGVVVAPVRALLQPIVAGLGDVDPVVVRKGDEIALDDLVRRLAATGYERMDLVERRGQFAVRGGIVDVFAPTAAHPVRVEFFGDEVEELRWFAVADQRSTGPADELWAPVCRELLLTTEVRERATVAAVAYPQLAELLGAVADGVALPGIEAVAPLVVEGMTTLPQLLPRTAAVVVVDPGRVADRAEDLVATSAEFLAAGWDVAAA
ncbi:MAG: hypothetical protein RLZ55_1161, partial [Actinomycetota bacterium]